jgi:L-alanine-DL-glutamate epimerase-like enolase superfamily enzyme
MKIRGISTHFVYTGPHRNWTLVKIDTDEGIHGWGEATVEGKEKTVAEAIHELERQLIGRDPFEIEKALAGDVSRRVLGRRTDPDLGDEALPLPIDNDDRHDDAGA